MNQPHDKPSLYCRVEIPQGSRNKYEWDPELDAIVLSRFLFSSVVYPTDYGFFPETLGQDGDPVDALICVSAPTFPGCMIEVKALGVLLMSDEEGKDEKVLCVPCRDPNWMNYERLEDVSEQLRGEIEHFFRVYKEREGKPVEVDGWAPRKAALELIEASRRRFQQERLSAPPPGRSAA